MHTPPAPETTTSPPQTGMPTAGTGCPLGELSALSQQESLPQRVSASRHWTMRSLCSLGREAARREAKRRETEL